MIVSCGEALIDFVPARSTGGENAYVARAGGSPFNVAVTVGRLGIPAGFLGSVSTDFFGTQLLSALTKSKVDARYVSRLDRPSTLAFVNLESVEPEYTFYDTQAAHRYWKPGSDIAADVTMLHLGFGALLPIDEPVATNLATLFADSKGQRILTFDPNVRQTVIRGRETAYRARLAEFFALADIIKISAADLGWLDPQLPPPAAAQSWLHAGASLVVVTAGEAGSTGYLRDGTVLHRAAEKITLVDTVGAGDSFMGALLAGLDACGVRTPAQLAAIDEETVEAALAFAAQVSAITCSRAGADPPWRDEVTLPVRASGAKGMR